MLRSISVEGLAIWGVVGRGGGSRGYLLGAVISDPKALRLLISCCRFSFARDGWCRILARRRKRAIGWVIAGVGRAHPRAQVHRPAGGSS